jgi:hypothetical protein
MARSFSKNSKYDVHPGDKSRKTIQRWAHKQDRAQTRRALRTGSDVMPVFRHSLDFVAH